MPPGVPFGIQNPLTENLDVGGFSIISSANGNVVVAPNGSGIFIVSSDATIERLAINTTIDTNTQATIITAKVALTSGTLATSSLARAQALANSANILVGHRGTAQTFGGFDYTGTIQGNTGVIDHVGTGTISNAEGVRSDITNFPGIAGTITNARCFRSFVDAEDGTIVNAIGYFASDNIVDTGTLTNSYGIYLEDQTGAATDNFSLLSLGDMTLRADAKKFFFGAVDDVSMSFTTDALDITLDENGSNSLTIGDGGTTNYANYASNGDLSFAGSAGFYPRRISQATIPAAGTGATQIDTGEVAIWHDSDDNEVFLIYNDATEGVKTIELI